MKPQDEIIHTKRLQVIETGIDGGIGKLYLGGINAEPMTVVWSWSGGWEHVSVSYRRKNPTWDEMCKVKSLFWNDDETVVQFHPKKSEYINIHPHCLHLWKKAGANFELPPRNYV